MAGSSRRLSRTALASGVLSGPCQNIAQHTVHTSSAIVVVLVKPVLSAHRWDAEVPGITWQRLMDNKNKELDRLNGVYMNLLDGAGVKYFEGRGKLVDAHTVDVGGKKYTVRVCSCIPLFAPVMLTCSRDHKEQQLSSDSMRCS